MRALLLFAFALGVAEAATAHGGIYVPPPPPPPSRPAPPPPPGGRHSGPGDVVPPSPAHGAEPRTPAPSPATPTRPSMGSPTTPGPTGPAGAGTGPTSGGAPPPPAAGGRPGPRGPASPRGIALTTDPTTWDFWWNFHVDRYLRLRAALEDDAMAATGSDDHFMGTGRRRAGSVLRPTDREVRERIAPALQRAMQDTDQRDITTACLVALAKIGGTQRDVDVLAACRERLTSADQEVRETAALCLGISQRPDALADLLALVTDDAAGRTLVDRAEVDDRTRAFAAYGIGLVTSACADRGVRQEALMGLRTLLLERPAGRDVRVAVIHALGLCNADPRTQPDIAQAACAALREYYLRDLGSGDALVQAHCATAAAKLLGRRGPDGWWQEESQRWKQLLLDDLTGRGRRSACLAQSAALGLGELCLPVDDASAPDAGVRAALLAASASHRDAQTRRFAVMALGRIGGQRCRDDLLRLLATGGKALEKPWAALALGVLCEQAANADAIVGDAIAVELRAARNPSARAAFAIALGLCGHRDAASDIRDLLADHTHQVDLAGHLCIALALMGDRAAIDPLRAIVADASPDPQLMQRAAVALGRLGDREAVLQLGTRLEDCSHNLAQLAGITTALTFVGDRRLIDPLLEILADAGRLDLARAFAAAALGGIADKEAVPFNRKIAEGTNYRAIVETLTDGRSGVLDIL